MSSKKKFPPGPGRIFPRHSSLINPASLLHHTEQQQQQLQQQDGMSPPTASATGNMGGENGGLNARSTPSTRLLPEQIRTASKRTNPPSGTLPKPSSIKSQDLDPFKQQQKTREAPRGGSSVPSQSFSPTATRNLSQTPKAQPYLPIQQSSIRYSSNIKQEFTGGDNEPLSKHSSKLDQTGAVLDLSSDTTTLTNGKSVQAFLKSLDTKGKDELLVISKKMVSEINMKNKLIYESKTNEKWILAQLAIAQNGSNITLGDNATAMQTNFTRSSSSVEDREFLQTLMAFKAELGAAKKKMEEHEVSLVILEKKRTAAEEEAAYLRTIIDPKLKDPSVPQVLRIKELEAQLNDTIQDYTTLQSKVSQWARASKRNQEGRIAAEAIQRNLEGENEALKAQLSSMHVEKEQVIPPNFVATGKIEIKKLEEQLATAQNALLNAEKHADAEIDAMERKQVELLDTIESLRITNQELKHSVGSRNEYQDIINKRTSMHLDVKPAPALVRNADDLDVTREYKFLKDKYSQLEVENEELRQSVQDLICKLEIVNQNYEKAMETVEDQEELQLTIKEMEADKKTLQDAYNISLDKVQQKTLAIEMLQRNVDRNRERMEPLQKSVEALDDLQDVLDQERYQKEELQDRLDVLEEDNQAQQKKILDLMEQLGNQQALPENAAMNEVLDLRDTVNEYKSMTDLLKGQVDEKSRQIEQLKKTKNSDAYLVQLEAASASAKEQLQTIEQLEELVAEDHQIIETISDEKAELEQVLHKTKSEHAKQSAEIKQLHDQIKILEAQQTVANLEKYGDADMENLKLEQSKNRGSLVVESYHLRIQELEESIADLTAEKGQLILKLQSLHEMEEDYKDEVAHRKDLEARLAEMNSELNFMQSEFDVLSQKNYALELQLSNTKIDRQSTISDLTDQSTNPSPIRASNTLLSKSQEDLTGLVSQLDAAEMEIEELRMQLAEKEMASTYIPEKVDKSLSPIKDAEDERIEDEFFRISLHEKDLQEKQSEIDELLNELDSLEERLLQVSDEKNDLERQSQRMLNEAAERHRMELERKIHEIDLLEERLKLSLNSSNSDDLTRTLMNEIENLKLQSQNASSSISHQEGIHNLKEELDSLTAQMKEKNETILVLQDQLMMKSQQTRVDDDGDLNAKLSASEKLLQEKDYLINELKSTIGSSGGSDNLEIAHQIQKLNSELADYKKKHAEALQQVTDLEETVFDLKDNLSYQAEIAEDAIKQIEQYENEILELRQQSSQVQTLQSTLKARDAELANLKTQATSGQYSRDEVEDLERTNEQLLEKIAALSQKLAQQDNKRMSVNPMNQKSLQQAKSELNEVKNQLNEAIVKITTFQNEKAELLDELDDLRDHNMLLISQLNALK